MSEPTLQERLRGGYLVTPEEAADALDAKDALIADLVEALEIYSDPCDATETKPCGYTGNMCCMPARAALAKAKGT